MSNGEVYDYPYDFIEYVKSTMDPLMLEIIGDNPRDVYKFGKNEGFDQ